MERLLNVRLLFLFALVGALSGVASGLFLESLQWATEQQSAHSWLLFVLPVAGAAIAWLYASYGEPAPGGTNLILDQIHNPRGAGVPLRLLPVVLIGTLLTHLFGGSAGREGTAVQMGGAIAGEAARRVRLPADQTRILLMCGISGGFSSVFGTPLAGTIFGMEVLALGGLRYGALIPCLVAALAGDEMVKLLGVAHSHYTIETAIPELDAILVGKVVIAAIVFGLVSALFCTLTSLVEHVSRRIVASSIRRTALGGVVIVSMTLLLGTRIYNGLSLPLLSDAFTDSGQVPTLAFLVKLCLTAITIGVGFKGGEVTPLFVIGATLGVSLAGPLELSTSLMAALGFISVFAAAANAPIACVIMGVELFGGDGVALFGIAVFIAYTVSGHRGIYHAQRMLSPKALASPRLAPGQTLGQMRHERRPFFWWRQAHRQKVHEPGDHAPS